MIGPTYQSKAAQAVLGPSHSPLIPEVLWSGWLGVDGALIAMTGLRVAHSAFGPTATGVTNTTLVDCGVAGVGWVISALGLFDAAAGVLILSAPLPAVASLVEGDPLVFEPGNLTFVVA